MGCFTSREAERPTAFAVDGTARGARSGDRHGPCAQQIATEGGEVTHQYREETRHQTWVFLLLLSVACDDTPSGPESNPYAGTWGLTRGQTDPAFYDICRQGQALRLVNNTVVVAPTGSVQDIRQYANQSNLIVATDTVLLSSALSSERSLLITRNDLTVAVPPDTGRITNLGMRLVRRFQVCSGEVYRIDRSYSRA